MELQIIAIAIEGIVGAVMSYLGYKLKKIHSAEQEHKRQEQKFKKLELLNTRMILIREINHYLERGFAPLYARTAVIEMYEEYHDLGGNGGIEEHYSNFLKLPLDKLLKG